MEISDNFDKPSAQPNEQQAHICQRLAEMFPCRQVTWNGHKAARGIYYGSTNGPDIRITDVGMIFLDVGNDKHPLTGYKSDHEKNVPLEIAYGKLQLTLGMMVGAGMKAAPLERDVKANDMGGLSFVSLRDLVLCINAVEKDPSKHILLEGDLTQTWTEKVSTRGAAIAKGATIQG